MCWGIYLLHVAVHAANRHDTKAVGSVLARAAEKPPTIQAFSADAGYRSTACEFVTTKLGLAFHLSTKIKDGFAVLPKRWIVESLCLVGQLSALGKRRRDPYRYCQKHDSHRYASANAWQAALKFISRQPLNPAEQIWQHLRDRHLTNRCFDSYEQIVNACCDAWNAFTIIPGAIRSLRSRFWANLNQLAATSS